MLPAFKHLVSQLFWAIYEFGDTTCICSSGWVITYKFKNVGIYGQEQHNLVINTLFVLVQMLMKLTQKPCYGNYQIWHLCSQETVGPPTHRTATTWMAMAVCVCVCVRACLKKGSFYIAQYPVRWTAQSTLHFLPSLAGLFIRVAAFSPLANSPPAISPAANGPPAKSPPPAAIRPPLALNSRHSFLHGSP